MEWLTWPLLKSKRQENVGAPKVGKTRRSVLNRDADVAHHSFYTGNKQEERRVVNYLQSAHDFREVSSIRISCQ